MTNNLFKNKYRIPSARLPGWDYSRNGNYFVTICVRNRECVFGKIEHGSAILSEIGNIAVHCWLDIPKHFPFVKLDEFIIMPNHVHGIKVIDHIDNEIMINPNRSSRDAACNVSTTACNVSTTNTNTTQFSRISPKRGSLPSIIRSYKSAVTKLVNNKFSTLTFAWQSRYHDRIIRNEKELFHVRNYINQNPIRWDENERKSGG